MRRYVVLNLLFRPRPYSDADIATISGWIRLFQSKEVHVIVTPPQERSDVFDRLKADDNNLFTAYPVTSFDTCDRWRAGLRKALDLSNNDPAAFLLWSADFDLNAQSETAALQLVDWSGADDLVVGTIQAVRRKQDIDTLGTVPLISLWFPDEFEQMRKRRLMKSRSELLRFSAQFLESTLSKRWFPTEQTIFLILQCLWENRPLACLPFTVLEDDEEARISPNVVEQVERMELWLKYMWRGRTKDWDQSKYLKLSRESARIVGEACCRLLLPDQPVQP